MHKLFLWTTACWVGSMVGCVSIRRQPPQPLPPIKREILYAAEQPDRDSAIATVAFVENSPVELQNPAPGEPGVEFAPVVTTPTAESSLTLAEIERLALDNHPAISAAAASARAAVGWRYQVGRNPNPTFGYFGQQIADRGTSQHGLFVEQEFVRGDKLALNREVLGHTQVAQQMEVETQRFRVLTDVRVRFFEALAAQQQVDAARSFAQSAERGVQVAIQRQQAEEGTLIETLQSKTLLSEVTLVAEQAEVAYRGAWRDLAAIAMLPSETPARLIADFDLPTDTPDWQAAYAETLSLSPELAVAQALVCEQQALLKRQRVQAVPNVTAQFGAGYDDGTDNGMINVQLSAPLPIANDNRGNISAAYAEYLRALHNVKRIEQSIQSRLARAAQEFDVALAAVKKYETEIIPQAEQSLQLSEQAYRAGELDFLQVLIVRRTYYESQIRSIAAKGQLAQAAAKVQGLVLTGGLDEPPNYTRGDELRGATFAGQ
jgi:cobalt-zinc-cadmium efflux system outer membrane protein